MTDIPNDIFTEPDDVADDTLANLGPLRRLAGIWEGKKGVDLNPKADGPERIHGEWWRSESETNLIRDYYRVETTDGARYWIFRDAPAEQGGGWWLHGVGEA